MTQKNDFICLNPITKKKNKKGIHIRNVYDICATNFDSKCFNCAVFKRSTSCKKKKRRGGNQNLRHSSFQTVSNSWVCCSKSRDESPVKPLLYAKHLGENIKNFWTTFEWWKSPLQIIQWRKKLFKKVKLTYSALQKCRANPESLLVWLVVKPLNTHLWIIQAYKRHITQGMNQC